MKPLSDASRDRIEGCLEDVVAAVEAGAHPTDAVEKSARATDLPPGHVALLARAYNTGATANLREAGKSAAERAADFPVADADEALARLYPDAPKNAALRDDYSRAAGGLVPQADR